MVKLDLLRYHVDIYVPPWARENILLFTDKLSGRKLVPSYHANKKVAKFFPKYRKSAERFLVDVDIGNPVMIDYIFEFYATRESNEIKKVCYRIPLPKKDKDIIIVVSSTGKIVTTYLSSNLENYRLVSVDEYEKGEIVCTQ